MGKSAHAPFLTFLLKGLFCMVCIIQKDNELIIKAAAQLSITELLNVIGTYRSYKDAKQALKTMLKKKKGDLSV